MTQEFPFFLDETDHLILMHKEVHFMGSFPRMLHYYLEDKPGVQEEFEIERIEQLARLETAQQSSLSPLVLSEEDLDRIQKAREMHKTIKKLYDKPSIAGSHELADLIFCEEEDPSDAIENLSAQSPPLSVLLPFLQEEDFYDPLFPGYGQVPSLICECIGKLRLEEAIIPLFEAFSKAEFFGEESIIHALFQIGAPAKQFLLSRVKHHPLTKDNANAAVALLPFKAETGVVDVSLDLLEDPAVQKNHTLFLYLLFLCEETTNPTAKGRLQKLTSLSLTEEQQEELRWILKTLC